MTWQDLRPGADLIARTRTAFLAALRVRYSSPLFRLPTAVAIRQQLRFHNTGPHQARSECCLNVQRISACAFCSL